jgi:predicted ATPase
VAELPSGTVTFLFTDIEGSTRLLHELGNTYVDALGEHRRVLREAFAAHGGVEVDTQGDAFFVAFGRASEALAAAREGQAALAEGPIRVRMGVHTGEPLATDDGYVGIDVHRAARIAAAGHGGQILVSQSTRDLAGSDSLRDLGEHRLKDLTAPERIYQFGGEDFPPLKSLNQVNLPVQPTPLVGRMREVDEVLQLLNSNRLLTLTGPGGSGKTRLAVQAVAELAEQFPDGVWFVSLAPVVDPMLVLPTIAATIGAKAELAEELRAKRLLLLLDNLEQVLDVAPQLADLLSRAPGVKLLVTSRERLSLVSEQEYVVPTLPLEDAVDLFVARARQLDPHFLVDPAVVDICRRLDGLPLAVELAAARIKVLSSREILRRLDRRLDVLRTTARDVPARQQTLRATLDWSYHLLSDEEKDLLAHLAIFAGSFDLAAAEAVAAGSLEVLESLVDKSLLRRTHEGRFFMLETIREYALERLEARDDREEVRKRHAEHAIVRATSDQMLHEWLPRIERDYADFQAALTWLAASESPALFLRLVARLGRFWDGRGRLREGRRWLELALERGSATTTPERAEALSRLGHIAWQQGDLETSAKAADAAQAAAAALGDERLSARQHMFRAGNALSMGDLDLAASEYELAAHMLRGLGTTPELVIAIHDLGLTALLRDDLATSRGLIEEAARLAREISHVGGEANAVGSLGFIELREARFDRAKGLLLEALRLEQKHGLAGSSAATNLVGLAAIAVAEGDSENACVFIGAYDAYRELIGASHDPTVLDLHGRVIAQLEGTIGPEEFERALVRGSELDLAEAIDYALASPELIDDGDPKGSALRSVSEI